MRATYKIQTDDIKVSRTISKEAILIENISIGDNGYTSINNCTYAIVRRVDSAMAQQMGENIIYLPFILGLTQKVLVT